MGPVNHIERPPYYRLPRCRPVGFEKPNHQDACDSHLSTRPMCSANSCGHQLTIKIVRPSQEGGCLSESNLVNEHHYQHQQQVELKQRQQQIQMVKSERSPSALPSYNSSPKPFVRQGNTGRQCNECRALSGTFCQCGRRNEEQQPPRIQLNDQPYPTSTVHKSMRGCQSPVSAETANYSRLISPTVMTASYGSVSPPTLSRSTHMDTTTDNSSHQQAAQHIVTSLRQHDLQQQQQQQQLQHRHQHQSLQRASSGKTGDTLSTLTPDSPNHQAYSSPVSAELAHQMLPRSLTQPKCPSNGVLPDSKRDEYMWNRQLERASIAHQTYRTLPIQLPKPKARHDLASGTYMQYHMDPTWDLTQMKPSSKDYEGKIQQAIRGGGTLGGRQAAYMDAQPMVQEIRRHQAALGDESVPAFNYREYIDSTRRAY